MKIQAKKKLDKDTKSFFCLLKFCGHFEDANETQTSDQLYQPVKVKAKTKWTPKETNHTLETFIDLVHHDINKIYTKKVKNQNPNYQMGNKKQ